MDSAALSAGYRRDAARLLTWFTRRVYDAQLALDLVGETYARAHAARRRFNGDPGDDDAVAAWTWGIARHVLTDALRRGAAEQRALARLGVLAPRLTHDEAELIEREAALGDLRTVVTAALSDLSAEQREAVRLRVVEELGYDAVARRLGITEQAARARVSRGLRALAGALDGTLPEGI